MISSFFLSTSSFLYMVFKRMPKFKINSNAQIEKLNCSEGAILLKINNHCVKGNTFLCIGGFFRGCFKYLYFTSISRVLQGIFKSVSRRIQTYRLCASYEVIS